LYKSIPVRGEQCGHVKDFSSAVGKVEVRDVKSVTGIGDGSIML
jgi:hypothetical protein